MTLTTLIIGLLVFALALTGLQKGMDRKLIPNFPLSLLQNFVGGLFVFSGLVKAVDPLGTAYKMEQYFAEFETTFAGTKAAFLAPMFPALAEYVVAFSVIMVVFEIFLGINLLIGAWRKFTAWAFFLLVLFFTFLTGFTYLTGYVPEGVNFFSFGEWGPYEPTSMKVTDCGCFGDFLKLEPRVSFFKDIFLLIPGFIFLFATRSMHQLNTGGQRALAVGLAVLLSFLTVYLNGYGMGWRSVVLLLALTGVQFLSKHMAVVGSVVVLTIYCLSNYLTDIPQVDFRPFAVGVNVAERKALEEEAEANVKVLAYRMTNKETGEVVELPFDVYLQEYAKYPGEEWDLDQVKSEPEVLRTKISDFEIADRDGNDITMGILQEKDPHFMIVAYKLYGEERSETILVPDSLFRTDTVITATDTLVERKFVRVEQNEEVKTVYSWDEDYVARWKENFLPIMDAASAAGLKVYAVTAYSDPERVNDFQEVLDTKIPFFTADDILLKTIVRSNPGPVLWQDGTILQKWHYKNIPAFEAIKEEYFPDL